MNIQGSKIDRLFVKTATVRIGHIATSSSLIKMDPFNFLNTFPIVRQDSNTSAGSSVGDSPIYSGLTGKLISHEDMEFQRNKEFYFNAMLRQFNPKAFAIVETANDVKLAIKYCQEHGVRTYFISFTHNIPKFVVYLCCGENILSEGRGT